MNNVTVPKVSLDKRLISALQLTVTWVVLRMAKWGCNISFVAANHSQNDLFSVNGKWIVEVRQQSRLCCFSFHFLLIAVDVAWTSWMTRGSQSCFAAGSVRWRFAQIVRNVLRDRGSRKTCEKGRKNISTCERRTIINLYQLWQHRLSMIWIPGKQ